MYSYKDVVRSDVREWIDDHKEVLQDVDRHDVFDVVYNACWIDDNVTGNASGSYTFSRYEARKNFFNDEDSEEYIDQMIEDGFTCRESVGKAVQESNLELLDVLIRCWLLCDAVTEVLDEMFGE